MSKQRGDKFFFQTNLKVEITNSLSETEAKKKVVDRTFTIKNLFCNHCYVYVVIFRRKRHVGNTKAFTDAIRFENSSSMLAVLEGGKGNRSNCTTYVFRFEGHCRPISNRGVGCGNSIARYTGFFFHFKQRCRLQ